MKMTFDKDASEGGFDLLPVGHYRASVHICLERLGSTGKPMWELDLTIIEPEGFAEKSAKYYLTFNENPKHQHFTFMPLQALGFDAGPGVKFEENPNSEGHVVSVHGRTVGLDCQKHEKSRYKDKVTGEAKESTREKFELFADPGPGNLAKAKIAEAPEPFGDGEGAMPF